MISALSAFGEVQKFLTMGGRLSGMKAFLNRLILKIILLSLTTVGSVA
jgi:hypothetical protein